MGVLLPILGSARPANSSFDVAAFLAANTVAYWRMDGVDQQPDRTGRGNGLSATDTIPSVAAGKLGNALSLNGSTDSVACSSTSDLQIDGDFIIASWVKRTSGLIPIVSKGRLDGGEYGLFWDDASLFGEFVFFSVGDSQARTSFALSPDSNWHLIVARYVLATGKMWLCVDNISQVETQPAGVTADSPGSDLTVGSEDLATFFAHGLIDDTCIVKPPNILTDTQFAAVCAYLWNSGAGRVLF